MSDDSAVSRFSLRGAALLCCVFFPACCSGPGSFAGDFSGLWSSVFTPMTGLPYTWSVPSRLVWISGPIDHDAAHNTEVNLDGGIACGLFGSRCGDHATLEGASCSADSPDNMDGARIGLGGQMSIDGDHLEIDLSGNFKDFKRPTLSGTVSSTFIGMRVPAPQNSTNDAAH